MVQLGFIECNLSLLSVADVRKEEECFAAQAIFYMHCLKTCHPSMTVIEAVEFLRPYVARTFGLGVYMFSIEPWGKETEQACHELLDELEERTERWFQLLGPISLMTPVQYQMGQYFFGLADQVNVQDYQNVITDLTHNSVIRGMFRSVPQRFNV